jgi:hypothetical protein
LLCSFLHSPVTSFLFGANIPLSTLFSNIRSLGFSPYCQRPSFTHIQNHRTNCNPVHSNFYSFRQQTRRQYVLDRMVASITRIQSLLNFLLNIILICCCRPQVFGLWHAFCHDFNQPG